MHCVAWRQTKTNGGIGRASINHQTFDDKKTLCGKKIPQNAFCYDAYGPTDCEKCLKKKDAAIVIAKTNEDRIKLFKKVVEELDGNYVFEDGKHRAFWDAYGGREAVEKRCIAYGKLSSINVWMYENWLTLQETSLP